VGPSISRRGGRRIQGDSEQYSTWQEIGGSTILKIWNSGGPTLSWDQGTVLGVVGGKVRVPSGDCEVPGKLGAKARAE